IEAYKKEAKEILTRKAAHYAQKHHLAYNSIRITSAKTRWGSCSSKKNLNFSYRLMMTPEFVQDYVVVHELAHLLHMNHSKKFWSQVESMYPDYKQAEKWLKENSRDLPL
ncbi:M48 family metallopeptidase, partial [Candidatus Gracilibacteria bacterium]|nr:M48 family metallopeptidase [Candidatus Gracilibacteria bacterium]